MALIHCVGLRREPCGHFYPRGFMVAVASGYIWESSPWVNVSNRYLGFKFLIHRQTHYGWARLNVHIAGTGRSATVRGKLTGYADETIPNKSIIAGKTKGPDVITVYPARLGRLTAGSSAIPACRVKQTAATTH